MIVEFTNHDGRKVSIAAHMIGYITEISAPELKEFPHGRAAVIMSKAGGGGGFYTRETCAELSALWNIALGLSSRLH